MVPAFGDEQKGERLIVLHTPLEVGVDELLKRLRDTNLPKLWLPRRENFFQIEALPFLGSGKMDLSRVKETAKKLATAVPATPGELQA